MIRVLHITARSDPGGGPAVIETILGRIGAPVEHFVASPADPPYAARFSELAGCCRTVEIPTRRFTLSTCHLLADFIRQHDIHIIHSHGFGAGLYGRILAAVLRLPVVHSYHGFLIPEHGWAGMLARYLVESCLAPLTTAGVVCSESERAKLSRLLPFRPAHLQVVHNTPGGQPMCAHIPSPRDRTHFAVISVGRLSRQKNPEALVRVAALLRNSEPALNFHFYVVGDGPRRQATERLVREFQLDDRVELLGATRASDWMGRADVLLSTSRGEGMPLALLEAMTAGLPVVASEVVGNVDLVRPDETGYLFRPGDLRGAVQALARLSKDPQLRVRLGESARRRVQQDFTAERFAASYAEIYREVASRRGNRLTEVPAP